MVTVTGVAFAQDVGRDRETVLAALTGHCATCHQAGSGRALAPRGPADILDLERVARDPDLVRPGVADASALYAVFIGPHRFAGEAASSAEIAAVARWINGLPIAPAQCQGRVDVPPVDNAALVSLALTSAPAPEDVRFVSLAVLWNACVPLQDIQTYRSSLGVLMQRLAGRATPVPVMGLGPLGLIQAFKLSDLGWSAAQWDAFAEKLPVLSLVSVAASEDAQRLTGSRRPILPAAIIAAQLPGEVLAIAVPGEPLVRGRGVLAALAGEHSRGLNARRLAAELGVAQDRFAERLERVIGAVKPVARRLRQGVVARGEADAVLAAIVAEPDGPPGAPTPPVGSGPPLPSGDGRLSLSLWTERLSYRTGEPIAFFAWASKTCHLTLVSVDRGGRATVLFPNELEPNNLIEGGREFQVPSVAASYRFKAGKAGRETLVGLCDTAQDVPAGMTADYEHQRFTMLGDWRQFETAALGSDADPANAKPDVEPVPVGSKRRARTEAAPSTDGESVRTAITYDVSD
jgi:hypothetical protein